VETPNSAQITKVTWVRLSSVTHSFDQNQRFNALAFELTSAGLIVTAPTNQNLAPPGHYTLFVLNRNGVPSVGKIIRIQ
jgi:galactose oxidase